MTETEYDSIVVTDSLRKFRASANWFYWIGGLTLGNTLLHLLTGRFLLSLIGITSPQYFGYFLRDLGVNYTLRFQAIQAFLIAVFGLLYVIFGYFSRRDVLWAYWIGFILYIQDLFFLTTFFRSPAILMHMVVLWFLFQGIQAGHRWKKERETLAVPS